MPPRSAATPMRPSRASISRTRVPLARPPMEGLHDISPTVSRGRGDERDARAAPRGGGRRLGARVSSSDDHDVEVTLGRGDARGGARRGGRRRPSTRVRRRETRRAPSNLAPPTRERHAGRAARPEPNPRRAKALASATDRDAHAPERREDTARTPVRRYEYQRRRRGKYPDEARRRRRRLWTITGLGQPFSGTLSLSLSRPTSRLGVSFSSRLGAFSHHLGALDALMPAMAAA